MGRGIVLAHGARAEVSYTPPLPGLVPKTSLGTPSPILCLLAAYQQSEEVPGRAGGPEALRKQWSCPLHQRLQARQAMNLDGEKKLIFISTNFLMRFSISFNYECRQQTTVILAVPETLSPKEITDISYHITVVMHISKYHFHLSLL